MVDFESIQMVRVILIFLMDVGRPIGSVVVDKVPDHRLMKILKQKLCYIINSQNINFIRFNLLLVDKMKRAFFYQK